MNLQNNKEIVLEAVKQKSDALHYISVDLKNNKEIILKCVKQNEFMLRYTSID